MSDYFEPWLNFKHPIVRQLAFSLASPNLLRSIPDQLNMVHDFNLHQDAFWAQLFEGYHSRLKQLDEDPSELIHFLARLKSTRLGLRFEHLIWFWLLDDEYHHFKLLGHSIQMIEGKNTLGELDFLILNQDTGQIEHWEVAIKFYLAEADLCLPNWYGLNRSDTLYRKLNHFSQKQFQFKSAQQHHIQKRYAVLKGQLYLPKHRSASTDSHIPSWINPSRRIGQWGHEVLANHYRLARHEWICPDQAQSSQNAIWWYNGLYRNIDQQHDYMFRQRTSLHPAVKLLKLN